MKEEILKLRAEGKSYNQIAKEIGCAKSTIVYHCSEGQKEKSNIRHKKRRQGNVLNTKIERFKFRDLSEKGRSFQRRIGGKLVSKRNEYNFTVEDLLKKIGDTPKCYITGKLLDLKEGKSYHLDHIIPVAKGGKNTLDNANILDATINKMKHDLTPDEFIQKCIEVLKYQGYKITKENNSDTVSDPVC